MAKLILAGALAGLARAAEIVEETNLVQHQTIPKDLHGFLNPHDPCAISFWIVSMAMIAATTFFLWESMAIGYCGRILGESHVYDATIKYQPTVPLEDLDERWCARYADRRCPLLLHALLLGYPPHVPDRLPIHRLVPDRAAADDRVLPHPVSREARSWYVHFLV